MKNLEMSSSRLEAFSDGVIAIIITIMVLELKVPLDGDPSSLLDLWPIFMSYALSFIMVAVYWINHHHLFHFVKYVNTKVLWSNNLLLFCMSLIPFFTGYVNEHERNGFSVAMYSGILLACALAFTVLRMSIKLQLKDENGPHLYKGAALKNWLAVGLYGVSFGLAFVYPFVSLGLNLVVGLLYFMPDLLVRK